ncbi:50S ribosomal protein L3 N(5)-glutamine methyltransferase [Spiribacter vilamensis]|uniref:[LSU ribosomal protein L3P]-glutamine N5-methyltransferase n=1 Tax=Spiribacter vilamensis TaxID=531306 RepID=A0A4Q8CYB2_9GAMM|nr:50S ribosomal protein L3 N(5)-glutamine methyltransferase [Spiribacter vilamensis]RZU97976.1 [LSU ribosomal protein L3P]-glutamine N5-methyltransferase [Spiribacter vilamensis]TVO61110.1 50S ribosomal protein L3 N(5)-glutamine methyltransferase [Spiribacter vilamensis]
MTRSSTDALHTLGDFIRWSASRFQVAGLHYGHGTDNALDEAAALVLGSLHLPPDLHSVYFGCALTADERALLFERIDQRVTQRRPVPYILGEAWFCGLAFGVDEQVLIPRSPIAELIESGFAPWVDPDRLARIADVGTGSGCIAIAAALALPEVEVDALDNAPAALVRASDNAARHGVAERVHVQDSDLLDAIAPEPVLDLIVTNPPYVDAAAMAALPPEYRHEPRDALAAGNDGLDAVRRLLPQAAERLTDQGMLIVEIGHGADTFEAAFPELPVTWLEFERGGQGVFAVDASTLRSAFTAR